MATGATTARSFRSLEDRLPLHPRHPFSHPPRRRLALEPVAEPLVDATVIVDLVLFLAEAVILARIHEHHEIIPAGPPGEVVELDALMPIDRPVRIADLHQHRRPELVHLRRR